MYALELSGRGLALVTGALVVIWVAASAVRTVILPRASQSRLNATVIRVLRRVFELRIGRGASYERRDAIMAGFGPTALLALLVAWVVLFVTGYWLIYVALGNDPYEAFRLSGSSIVTLGFASPAGTATTAVVVTEGLVGLIVLALLITYLPTMYAGFQQREALVTKLEVRAGSPPTGVEMLERFQRLRRMDRLTSEVWDQWEDWFVQLEESHTSLPVLNYFRSPQAHRSWITAAGAVLDAAALYRSTVEWTENADPQADLCIRAGYLALRQIASFYRLPFNRSPSRGDLISIAREEFDQAYDRLESAGLPVRADREAAWSDFAGWRVNYDDVLLLLADYLSAPYAPWSSDRGPVSPGARPGSRHRSP